MLDKFLNLIQMLKQLSLRGAFVFLFLGALSYASVSIGFHDVPGHPFEPAINYVKGEGIVEGYEDGSYKPDAEINRAEFTKIIVGAVHGAKQEGGNCFPDVKEEWFAPFICTAQNKGIIEGYPDGTFKPDNKVNYAEALKIVLNSYNAPVGPEHDEWFIRYLEFAEQNGLSFAPGKPAEANVTRGEMAELIFWSNGKAPEVHPPEPAQPVCQSKADCAQGEECNNGKCVVVQQMVQCTSNADCAQGEFCNSVGDCEKTQPAQPPKSCKYNGDCGPKEACVASLCSSASASYPSCGSNNDCYEGQTCNSGTCETRNLGPACKTHADCTGQAQFCQDGYCFESAKQCIADKDCDTGKGEKCDTTISTCIRSCSTDNECPIGSFCTSGKCDSILVPDCDRNAECNGGTCDPTHKRCY